MLDKTLLLHILQLEKEERDHRTKWLTDMERLYFQTYNAFAETFPEDSWNAFQKLSDRNTCLRGECQDYGIIRGIDIAKALHGSLSDPRSVLETAQEEYSSPREVNRYELSAVEAYIQRHEKTAGGSPQQS